ncbi:MAG: ferrochelatase [Gammaproteobacteria bacterium]|nr:ferrochelatase [Gammaproteobacteria bacterium]
MLTSSPTKKIGVLLSNLGTPDAPTPAALRRYLAEFLSDRRVVDLPRPLWWLILHGIILRTRPARSARLYQKIWQAEGSPLLLISRAQQQGLQRLLDAKSPNRYLVSLGMRYGNPSLNAALSELEAAGCGAVIVLPLYPQNSCATTASTFDALAAAFKQRRHLLPLHFINNYHDHPDYINALAESVKEAWQQQPRGQLLLISFHGTPQRYQQQGDPYYGQCQRTAELLAAALELDAAEWKLTFQSRFGREPWLQPYTDETMAALPATGVRSIDVICPGFAADCLETLEEIGEENRQLFIKSGGEQYRYISALNETASHLQMMSRLVKAAQSTILTA